VTDAVADPPSKRELFRLFLSEKRNPGPFYEALAATTVRQLPQPLKGKIVLDLGAGLGQNSAAIEAAGATVVAVDTDSVALLSSGKPPRRALVADGGALPVRGGVFDGVVCSNVLEHTPRPNELLDEMARILRPGGWVWLSWTNWYSPWGGHEITPLHYLGPKWGLAAHRRLRGEPRKNVPGIGLFPTFIGSMLRTIGGRSDLEIVDARPRYYPSQRWILRFPVVREVLTWNCLIVMRRVP
jgi:SAM-dependent methyltransferase